MYKTTDEELIDKVKTSGDLRRFIVEVMIGIRDGKYTAVDAQAMISGFKELNNSLQVDINFAKLHIQAEKEGHSLGRAMKEIGQNIIDGS